MGDMGVSQDFSVNTVCSNVTRIEGCMALNMDKPLGKQPSCYNWTGTSEHAWRVLGGCSIIKLGSVIKTGGLIRR
jgi:hypothetical protein